MTTLSFSSDIRFNDVFEDALELELENTIQILQFVILSFSAYIILKSEIELGVISEFC